MPGYRISTKSLLPNLLFLGCVACPASSALAWNKMGHMTVAAAAWKDMTPDARSKATALLRLNPDYGFWVRSAAAPDVELVAFVRAATWPDEIRGTYQDDGIKPPGLPTDAQNIGYSDCLMHRYWHFKDIGFSTDGTPVEDAKEPNALTEIQTFSAALASPTVSDEIKSYDLAWLLHLVGDVHQPLHATARFTQQSKHGDGGGNQVRFCLRNHSCDPRHDNLHTFWDDALGNSEAASTAMKLACVGGATSAHCLPVAPADAVAIDDPAEWLQESFERAKAVAYKRPVGPGRGPYYITAHYKLVVGSEAEKRAALAGARLARLLNRALSSGVTNAVAAPPLADATTCPRLN